MISSISGAIDQRFRQYVLPIAHMESLFTRTRWAEGPVYFPVGKYLLRSDILNDRLLHFDETVETVATVEFGEIKLNPLFICASDRCTQFISIFISIHRQRDVLRKPLYSMLVF